MTDYSLINQQQTTKRKKKRVTAPSPLAGTEGRGGITPLEVQRETSALAGTSGQQVAPDTQGYLPPQTIPVIPPPLQEGVEGYVPQAGSVATIPSDIEAALRDATGIASGPVDRTLINLTKAHYEVFGSWPSWSLTADILESGEVEFPTYEEALSFFQNVKRSFGASGKEWQLDAQGQNGLIGANERAKGTEGFGADSDLLDPEMLASWAPKSVDDFLFGPYIKKRDQNRVATMARQDRLRLDELLIALPKQWAISNLSDRLSARSRRFNPDRDEDEAMMEELNQFLRDRVPTELAPAPTAAWQQKTEDGLRYLQMMRAASLYVVSDGEDPDAAAFLHTQGYGDIISTLEEQIRLPADPTGRTDAAKRAWVQDWWVRSRNPGISERVAVHQLADLNINAVTIAGQRMIGNDHLAGYAGTIKGWFKGIPGAEQVAEAVASEEFQKVVRPAVAVAGDIVDFVKPAVAVPLEMFIETYEFYDKYADAFQSGVRAADDSVLATVLKPFVLPFGFLGLIPGQPEGAAKTISGTDAAYSSLWSELFTQVFRDEDGDIEWVGDFVEKFHDNLKRREQGLPADYASETLAEMGVNPLTHPELAFLATFALDSVRDLGVAKVAGLAATAVRGTERFAQAAELARTTLHRETTSQTILRFYKRHADRELAMSDAEAKALRVAGEKTAKAGKAKTASAGKGFVGEVTQMFGIHPRDAVELRDFLNESRALGFSDEGLKSIIDVGIGQRGAPGWMARTGKSNLSADSWGLSWRMRERMLLDPESFLYRGNHPVMARWFERLFENPVLAVTDEQLPNSTRQVGFGYRTAFKPEELREIIDDDLIWAAGHQDWVLYDELAAIKDSGDITRYATIMQGVFADMESNAIRELMRETGLPLAQIPKDLITTRTVELRNLQAHLWARKVGRVMLKNPASKRFTKKFWKKEPEQAQRFHDDAKALNPDIPDDFIPEAAQFRVWEHHKLYEGAERSYELLSKTAGGEERRISLPKQGEPTVVREVRMEDGTTRKVRVVNEQSIGADFGQLDYDIGRYRMLLDGDDQTMGLRQVVHDLGLGDAEQIGREADAIDDALRLSMQAKEARHPNKIVEKLRKMGSQAERDAYVAALEERVRAKQKQLSEMKKRRAESEAHYAKRRQRAAAAADRASERHTTAKIVTVRAQVDELSQKKAAQGSVEQRLEEAKQAAAEARARVAAAEGLRPEDLEGWDEGLPLKGDVLAGGPIVWGALDPQATELQMRIRAANEAIAAGLEKGQVEPPGSAADIAENLTSLRDELLRAEGYADELRQGVPGVQAQLLDISDQSKESIAAISKLINDRIEAADASADALRAAVAEHERMLANARVAESQRVALGETRPGVVFAATSGKTMTVRTSTGNHWEVVKDNPLRPGIVLGLAPDDLAQLRVPQVLAERYGELLRGNQPEKALDLIIDYFAGRFYGHWETVRIGEAEEIIAGPVRYGLVDEGLEASDELGLTETLREGEEAAAKLPSRLSEEQAAGIADIGGGVKLKGKLTEAETQRVFVPPDEALRDLFRRMIAEAYRRDNIVFDLPETEIGTKGLKRGQRKAVPWGEENPPRAELPLSTRYNTPVTGSTVPDEFGRPLETDELRIAGEAAPVTEVTQYQRELVWDPKKKKMVPEGKLILNKDGEPIPMPVREKPIPGGAARIDRFRSNDLWLLAPDYDDSALFPKATRASWKGKVVAGEELNPTVAGVLSAMLDDFIERGYFAPIMTDLPEQLLKRSTAIAEERELFRELRGLGGKLHQNVPMYYTAAQIAKQTGLKASEVFTDPNATGTLRLIQLGKRTSTTRGKPLGKIGDRVTFKGDASGAEYKITGTHVLTAEDLANPKVLARLSETEGYTIEAIKRMKEFRPGQVLTRFERIEGTGRKLAPQPSATTPTPVSMPLRPLEAVTAEMQKVTENIGRLRHRTHPHMLIEQPDGSMARVTVKAEEAEMLIANLKAIHKGLQQEARQANEAARAAFRESGGRSWIQRLREEGKMPPEGGDVSAGGPAFWQGVESDAVLAAREAQDELNSLLLEREAMLGELGPGQAAARAQQAFDQQIEEIVRASRIRMKGIDYDDDRAVFPPRYRGTKTTPGMSMDDLAQRIGILMPESGIKTADDLHDWLSRPRAKPLTREQERMLRRGLKDVDARIAELQRAGSETLAYLRASAPPQRLVSSEGMNAAEVLANAAPVDRAAAAMASAKGAADELSELMQATVGRLEREWLEADAEIKQLETKVAAGLAGIKGATAQEMSDLQLERIRQIIDWLDPRATPEEYIEAARHHAFDEQDADTLAHTLWLLENHPEQALGWAVQPSREWQLRIWGSMGYNPSRVAKFRAGGLIRRTESLWADKFAFHRWSLDDMTTLYKTIVMFKVSTMLRITMADEFTRLFSEGINPFEALKGAKMLKALDKLPEDIQFKLSEMIAKSVQGNVALFDINHPKAWLAYRHLLVNDRRDPTYTRFLYGKQIGEGQMRDEVEFFLADEANDAKLREIVGDYLRAADDGSDPRGLMRAWYSLGLQENEGLYRTAVATHRLVDAGTESLPTRAWVQKDKWAKRYGPGENVYMDTRNLSDALVDYYEWWYGHEILGSDWRPLRGFTDAEIARFKSGDWRMPITADEKGVRITFGDADELSPLNDPSKKRFRALQEHLQDPKVLADKEETARLLPGLWGHSDGTVTAGLPVVRSVRDKMYSILDYAGSKLNEMVFTSAFNAEKKLLMQSGMEELAAERNAIFYAREYVHRVMFNNATYMGEDMLRNVILFLPAYRQFLQYWVPYLATHPGVSTLVYRANRDKDQFQDMRVGPVSLDLSRMSFLINQGDNRFTGWLPSGAPLITLPVSAMINTGEETEGTIWGSLAGNWPFEYANEGMPLNSPIDKMIYGLTGRTLPWPFGSDATRNPWRELQIVRAAALKGEKLSPDDAYWQNRMNRLKEGGWNFLMPVGMRFIDSDVEKMQEARMRYNDAVTPEEADEILSDPANATFKSFIEWQNKASWDQLQFLKEHPEIIPYMVSGFEGRRTNASDVGFLWSKLRDIGVADPAGYVKRLDEKVAQINRVIEALDARKARDEEVAWWERYKKLHADDHDIARLQNAWQNSTDEFAPGGVFYQQGRLGYAARNEDLNGKYVGISDPFTGITAGDDFDSDAYRFAALLDASDGPARTLLQMSPNYPMYLKTKLDEHVERTTGLLSTWRERRMTTRMTGEDIRAAGYSAEETVKLQKAVKSIDELWDAADAACEKYGKYGYATREGRAIRKQALTYQNNLIDSSPLLREFLGDNITSMYGKSYLTKPAYQREDLIRLDEMDAVERETFYRLVSEKDPETDKPRWDGLYLPEGEKKYIAGGEVLGYVPTKEGWLTKLKVGEVVGLVKGKVPKEGKQLLLDFERAKNLARSMQTAGEPTLEREAQWLRALKKSYPDWARRLIEDAVRASAWEAWLELARKERHNLRTTKNDYYSGAPGFSLQSKYGMRVKKNLLGYARLLGRFEPTFATEFGELNRNNEMVNAILGWYL